MRMDASKDGPCSPPPTTTIQFNNAKEEAHCPLQGLIYLNLSSCLTFRESETFLFLLHLRLTLSLGCLQRDHVFVIANTLIYTGYTHPSHSFY